MSNQNTKVIADTTEDDIKSALRTLHGKVLNALQECGLKPNFVETFDKCGSEDYKILNDTARALLNAKRKARWEARIAGIRIGVQGVINTYMAKACEAKKSFDSLPDEVKQFASFPTEVSVPVGELSAAWAQGTPEAEILKDLKDLQYTISKGANSSFIVKVPFKAEPESGKVVVAA